MEQDSLSESDTEYNGMFNITTVGTDNAPDDLYVVPISINGQEIIMEIDTGCRHTLVNEETSKQICKGNTLHKSRKNLTTFLGEEIPVKGEIGVSVCYNNMSQDLQLTVVEGKGPNLLGRNWLRVLGIDWSTVNKLEVNEVQTDEKPKLKEDFLDQYKELFKDELETFRGPKVRIYIDQNAEPQFFKARSVPFAYKTLVKKELDRLIQDGILTPVPFSDWAAPVVPVMKQNGSIRLCGNYSLTVNKYAKKEAYPIPNIEELYNRLRGGVLYTKLDLNHGYAQLVLDEDSRKYTTINTTKGIFEYTRLPYGISAAPGIFQRTMDNLLQGIPMCCVYLDDILVSGKTVSEHNANLKLVLDRLQSHGLRLREKKCTFMEQSVEYLGHKLDSEGVHPTGKKFAGVQNAVPPKNVIELRSYLGILNYYRQFLKNLSTELAPLYELLHDNVKWTWEKAQQKAFEKSKELLKSATLLIHYNPELPLLLQCDASPVGVACVMSHIMSDKSDRPIMYASHSLNKAERNYSQLEREALSIVYGVKYFHKYIAGREFNIVTDHKPLLGLFNPNNKISHTSSMRFQKWCLMLGGYNYNIIHKSGTKCWNK